MTLSNYLSHLQSGSQGGDEYLDNDSDDNHENEYNTNQYGGHVEYIDNEDDYQDMIEQYKSDSFDEDYDGNFIAKYDQNLSEEDQAIQKSSNNAHSPRNIIRSPLSNSAHSAHHNHHNHPHSPRQNQLHSPRGAQINSPEMVSEMYSFKPNISPFAKQLKQDHISLRAKQVLEESNKKLQEIAKDLEKKYNNHSFHPQINSSYVLKRERSNFHESVDDRIHEKVEHYKRMEEKKQELEKKSEHLYTPEISTYSKTLERQEPIYERLYKLRKVIHSPDMSQNEDRRDSFSSPPNSARRRFSEDSTIHTRSNDDFSFQPQINDTPQHILEARKGKIEDRMYNDAFIREQKREQEIREEEMREKVKRQTSFSSKTRKLAKQRVIKEIQIAFDKVSTKVQGEEPHVTYVQLGHCLGLLGLFKSGNSREERRDENEVRIHEEIWTLMDPEDTGKVIQPVLMNLLCPLIDPEMFPLKVDNEFINKVNIKQLSMRMKELSVNKLAYSKSTNLLKEVRNRVPVEEPTFTPKINNVSKSIDSRNSRKVSLESSKTGPRYEILFQKETEKKQRLDSLRKSIDEKLMKECSFQPQLQTKLYRPKSSKSKSAGSRFEHLYNLRKDIKPTTPPSQREEKELEDCTFKPNTSASQQYREHVPIVSSRAQIRGFDKQIDRMKKAQQERNRFKNFYESLRKDIDAKWEGRIKQNGAGVEFQPTEVKPFNFNLDKRTRSKPLLYMDVNLGPGRTGRIGIHANDDPEVLANNFAISYRLDQVLTRRLQDLIYQNMILNNIPMGDATQTTPKKPNDSRVDASHDSDSYRSPAATYAGSHRRQNDSSQFDEQYEEETSYIEEADEFHASPILRNKPPVRESPGYAKQIPPKPEPSPSRRLYDSLRQLKEFTENSYQ